MQSALSEGYTVVTAIDMPYITLYLFFVKCFCIVSQQMDQFILSSITMADIPAESADAIKSLFASLGVEKTCDVHYITESDLTSSLKLVHARKLTAYWKSLRYVTTFYVNIVILIAYAAGSVRQHHVQFLRLHV